MTDLLTTVVAMSDRSKLSLQVLGSVALVAAVIWFMWRLPRKGDAWYGAAPFLALAGAWLGLFGCVASVALWFVASPRAWLPLVLLGLGPGAIAASVLVLWVYRGDASTLEAISMQRMQARVGLVLGSLTVMGAYLFVMLQGG